jgi:hypothetical protein
MTFSNKVPGPVAAMMREVEGLRLKDRGTVTDGYKDELSKAEEKRKQAQTERERNLSEAANQEAEYIGNANLVAEALEGIDAGIRQKIARVKNSSRQTWELFCKENPLNRAIQNVGKEPAMARVFFCLLNPKEPQFCIYP